MTDIIALMQKTFEESKHIEDGVEFWYGRELMPLLGYAKWERFMDTITRAQNSCTSSGKAVEDYFFPVSGKTSSPT